MRRRSTSIQNSVERRHRAEEERRRREIAATLFRIGLPKCDCGCGKRADDLLINGDAMLPMASACAAATRQRMKVSA
jgi:hypothetical protein